MTRNPGFGLFSRLPYELREQIWQEFIPSGEDHLLGKYLYRKAHLEILRTSRGIYDEISTFIYSNTFLQFDFSPLYFRDPYIWTTLYFNRIFRRKGKCVLEKRAMWRLEHGTDIRSRGFYNLGFHPKLKGVLVNLFPPHPLDPGQLFWLWTKVTQFVDMLNESSSFISHLTVRLQKFETDDWLRGNRRCSRELCNPRSDHDLVTLPFYTLRNVGSIKIQAHSNELIRKMDWSLIDWASGIFSGENTKNRSASKSDLDEKIASDFFWIHQELFIRCIGWTGDMMRRYCLSNWYSPGEIRRSNFEEKMIHIINTYPGIVSGEDSQLRTVSHMHRSMVVLHHYAKLRFHGRLKPDDHDWDPQVWLAYQDGIPVQFSTAFDEHISKLLVEGVGIYFKHTRQGGIFSRLPQVIEEWRSGRPLQCWRLDLEGND